jgi:hypothetical protein
MTAIRGLKFTELARLLNFIVRVRCVLERPK